MPPASSLHIQTNLSASVASIDAPTANSISKKASSNQQRSTLSAFKAPVATNEASQISMQPSISGRGNALLADWRKQMQYFKRQLSEIQSK